LTVRSKKNLIQKIIGTKKIPKIVSGIILCLNSLNLNLLNFNFKFLSHGQKHYGFFIHFLQIKMLKSRREFTNCVVAKAVVQIVV